MSANVVPTVGADPFDLARLCRYFSERSPQPVVAVEGATHIVRYFNPAFGRLAGKAAVDLIGRPFAAAVPEGAGNRCLALLDRVFRTGVPENLAEQEHRQSSPAYWSYVMWAILGADDRPAGVMIQVTDATDTAAFRRQATSMNEALMVSSVRQHELIETIEQGERARRALEAHMFQVQKLESLGVLAGGIAHDLNNMLTPVLGFTELAKDTLPNDSPASPMLDVVSANALRAADLVRQILAYAGKGQFVIQPVDLSALVRGMSGLLGSAVSVNTELVYELAPDLPPTVADETQIRQVIMNLVTNASEALEPRAAVSSPNSHTGSLPEGYSVQGSRRGDRQVERGPAVFLEVTDSGCGMTPDVLEKIFDPFFTTKFTGRGLGLAVVHGIARGHGGTLRVHSKPGCGSTFRLLLPCSAKAIAAPVVLRPSGAWRGTGTVLVIDDEPGIRDIASRVLEQAGLKVLVAGDGQEGVEVFRDSKQRIDAVVLDLTMPRMGGIEAAGVLRGLRPDLPVVLISGYHRPGGSPPVRGPRDHRVRSEAVQVGRPIGRRSSRAGTVTRGLSLGHRLVRAGTGRISSPVPVNPVAWRMGGHCSRRVQN